MRTPALVIDKERLHANIDRVAARAQSAGVDLRPHAKTHKSVDIARMQLEAGAIGLTVATVGEAEVFAEAGIDDLFIAYPLWLDDDRAARLRELAQQARITIGVDNAASAERAATLPVDILIEVDSGHHRSGCAPEDVSDVAARAGDRVRGVFTFPGHSYSPTATTSAARDEATALQVAAAELRMAGIEPTVISGGSTPSLRSSDTALLTELRPGVYVFGDAQQWELGSCTPEDIALTCHTTVISHAGGRVVVDAGSKVLGADRAPYATGWGRLLDHPEARIVLLSEHHAVIEMPAPLPALGSTLRLVPNHACNAVNLVDELHWYDDTGGQGTWPVSARGANS